MEDTSYLTKTRFTEFALEPQLLQGLADAGFEYCTKIQAQALPVALASDILAGQCHRQGLRLNLGAVLKAGISQAFEQLGL